MLTVHVVAMVLSSFFHPIAEETCIQMCTRGGYIILYKPCIATQALYVQSEQATVDRRWKSACCHLLMRTLLILGSI